MDLIFYSAAENGNENRVLTHLNKVVPAERIVICRTVEDLSLKLMRPLDEMLALVLLIAYEKDLTEILTLQEVLHNLRIILIISEAQRCPVDRVHALRPRFVAYADEDLAAVAVVLDRIKWKTN